MPADVGVSAAPMYTQVSQCAWGYIAYATPAPTMPTTSTPSPATTEALTRLALILSGSASSPDLNIRPMTPNPPKSAKNSLWRRWVIPGIGRFDTKIPARICPKIAGILSRSMTLVMRVHAPKTNMSPRTMLTSSGPSPPELASAVFGAKSTPRASTSPAKYRTITTSLVAPTQGQKLTQLHARTIAGSSLLGNRNEH